MGPLELLNHLLNLLAPAVWVALAVSFFSRFFMKKKALAPGFIGSLAINFMVCALVLAVGLWFFGRDAKMSTYAAMAVFCATTQWFLQRGWRV